MQLVDFVIWQLFSRASSSSEWPSHLLCDGFRKGRRPAHLRHRAGDHLCSIPGIYVLHPNPQVETVKQAPWPQLLKLLGRSGSHIMMDLLRDCAVFTSLARGSGNYRQISGITYSP